GRAAKRMSELCGREAKTVHRLLEVTVDGRGEMVFNRTILNPLAADAVILDELSMVDVELMSSLLAALKEGARLILVGDADQLPSVGAGCVLESLLESGLVPSVQLDEIFRQAEASRIVVGAHEVKNGRMPPLAEKTGDLFFLPRRTAREMADTVVDLVVNRLPNRLSILPEDVQILLPNRRGAGGTEELNPLLQEALNPRGHGKREVRGRFSVFREGDRVMQTANNYEIEWRKNDSSERGTGIFNGDVGVILSIDPDAGNMVIRFDDRTAIYRFDLLDQIELAYAVTVHKSQGSEYPTVIFGASLSRSRLLNRSLLYTAMTRAKNLLIMVGQLESIREMVENARPTARWSLLSRFLSEESKHSPAR
ncbi:MAG: AAA family ATPase, partial [Clostridia bacterium]|nr:AAA family ATPase [Clostridia bacterium]